MAPVGMKNASTRPSLMATTSPAVKAFANSHQRIATSRPLPQAGRYRRLMQ
jgi:hypothetical protein